MGVDAGLVKKLRDACGAGMMDCKMALTEAEGDMDEASRYCARKAWLRRTRSLTYDQRRHGGLLHPPGAKVGVLIEVNCETDLCAQRGFQIFVHDVAMHIAAASPLWVSRRISQRRRGAQRWNLHGAGQVVGQARGSDPQDAEGKLSKWYSEVVC